MEITANIAGYGLALVRTEGDRIASVRALGAEEPGKPWIGAGFVDLQLNGFAGIDFSDPELDPEKAVSILPAVWRTGVTTFCATLITNSIERLRRNFHVLEAARQLDSRFAQTVPGYHLEGPYLSPGGARGAHNPNLMRLPCWDEFASLQEAAGGNIAIVTLAPELTGAGEFIRRARAAGLIVAIGHTDATPEQIHEAVDAGAQLCTHLGNGCPQLIHRHQNPLWAQMACDQLDVSLICDGFHVPSDLVRVVRRVKGVERCILVTDAVHVAELPPGRYSLVGRDIELLPNGQVVTSDRESMAGSALSMNRAVPIFQKFAGVSLSEALQAAATNPGRVLRCGSICTEIASGQLANLVVFHPGANSLHIEKVLLQGKSVYDAVTFSAAS